MYTLFCVLFLVIFCTFGANKTRVKTLEFNVVVFARFLRRSLKRRCSVSAAQNSFLTVAGATGSHYLTWMMLKQFGLRGETGFSKEKVLQPAPQSQELVCSWFLFAHLLTRKNPPSPNSYPSQRSRIVGRAAVTVSGSHGLGGNGFLFFVTLFLCRIKKIQIKGFFSLENVWRESCSSKPLFFLIICQEYFLS